MIEKELFSLDKINEKSFHNLMDFPWKESVLILINKNENQHELIKHFSKINSTVFLTTLDLKINPKALYIFENIDVFFEKNKINSENIFDSPIPSEAEKKFFSFLEHLKNMNSYLLITAGKSPSKWNVCLEDLRSRFKTIPVV